MSTLYVQMEKGRQIQKPVGVRLVELNFSMGVNPNNQNQSTNEAMALKVDGKSGGKVARIDVLTHVTASGLGVMLFGFERAFERGAEQLYQQRWWVAHDE